MSSAAPEDTEAAAQVDRAVDERPWLETLARIGWVAKGVVYALMGGLVLTLAVRHRSGDAASPEGALGFVAAQTGGRVLLAALSLGLVLYVAWRVVSVFVVSGHDAHAILDRIGYGFSAAFYSVLAVSAFVDVVHDTEPDDSRTVERLSTWVMERSLGRTLLVITGVVVVIVGAYFLRRALKGDFADGLRGVHRQWHQNRGAARVIYVTGAIGWFGRGLVTSAVGFFVARSAWRFDPNDARGFDRALKHLSDEQPGTFLVGVAGVLLVIYGVYCLVSASRRELSEPSS